MAPTAIQRPLNIRKGMEREVTATTTRGGCTLAPSVFGSPLLRQEIELCRPGT